MKHLGTVVGASLLALVFAPAALAGPTYVVDFDTDAAGNGISAGQVLDDEYQAWGLTISAASDNPPPDLAVAFNTDSITGNDSDLTAGNAMVAIIEENSLDADNDGFLDDGPPSAPDDEAAGGTIALQFNRVLNTFGIDFIDIEKNGEIEFNFYNAANSLVGSLDLSPVNGYTYADGSLNQVAPTDVSAWQANRVEVVFETSGAIDNLEFSPVPEPATIALAGSGIALLAARRLRNRKNKA